MTFFLNGPATPPKIKANNPSVDLPTWGEGLGAAYTASQLETDSNFVASRRRIGVKEDLAGEVVPRLGIDQIRPIIEERNAKAVANGMPSQVVEIPDNVEDAVALLGPNFADRAIEMARRAAEANPEAWADVDLSDEAIENRTNEILRAEYEDAQQILEMMPGGRASAGLIGGIAGMTADVKNLPFLFMGGGGSIARVMGKEAVINMAAEGAFLPAQYKMAERLDIPDPSVASQLAMAAVGGAVFGGVMETATRGFRYFRGRNKVQAIGPLDEIDTQMLVDQAEDILTSDTARPFEQIDRLMDDAVQKAQEPPYRLENPINPERPPLLLENPITPADPPEIVTTQLEPAPDSAPAPTVRKKPANRRPTSLKSFVVNEGGIWKGDDGGELADLEYRRPGFLKKELRQTSTAGNNGGGRRVDEMRERAIEEGYLPEGATINDFIDALSGDVRGEARAYSMVDIADAEEWRIFDGEDDLGSPIEDFDAMERGDGRYFIEPPDQLQNEWLEAEGLGGGDRDALIVNEIWDYFEDNGYGDLLTQQQKDEITSILQEYGGDPELLIERMLEREIDYVRGSDNGRAPEGYTPFEADQEIGNAGGRTEQGVQRPDAQSAEAGSGGTSPSAGGTPPRATESTSAGEQTLIDGVAPVTMRDRLQAQQNAPLRGDNAAADDGLFDVGARSQIDMFSDPASPEAREMQEVVANNMRTEIEADGDFDLEIEMPDGGKRVMSANGLLDYLDEGDAFASRIELCGKGPS